MRLWCPLVIWKGNRENHVKRYQYPIKRKLLLTTPPWLAPIRNFKDEINLNKDTGAIEN